MYRPITSIEELLKVDAEHFFIDLEETLLAPNVYYEKLAEKEYSDRFLALCSGVKISDVMFAGKNSRRTLIEAQSPMVLKALKSSGKNVYALTSGFPSKYKQNRLETLGVFFDHYIYTKGESKGPFLINFLQKNEMFQTGGICFVDNDLSKIENVNEYLNLHFPNRKIDLLLFDNSIYFKEITIEDFENYWKDVIKYLLATKKHQITNIEEGFN